jgi:hypothetical protein
MMDSTALGATRLDRFGTLCVSGADARTYLQGQLSFDVERLTSQRMEIASVNSAQGRVQAVSWLIERSDGIVLLLPASMVDATLARLRKYTLRAKVKIEPGADRLAAYAVEPQASPAPRAHVEQDSVSFIGWPGAERRTLMLASPTQVHPSDSHGQDAWHLADIRAGLPQVYPQTHEQFVAQMLNLDLMEGISFEKGCYTGQEIIARTHFRGTVKRRMFRFRAACKPPQPATRIVAAGNHAGEVVDAAAAEGGCEVLAVIATAQVDAALELDGMPGAQLERMPLPY